MVDDVEAPQTTQRLMFPLLPEWMQLVGQIVIWLGSVAAFISFGVYLYKVRRDFKDPTKSAADTK